MFLTGIFSINKDHQHHHYHSHYHSHHQSIIEIIFVAICFYCTNINERLVSGEYFGKYAGSLRDWPNRYGIHGQVYFVNKQTLFIYNFSYNGQGSEVYFKVGSGRKPTFDNGFIVPDELGRFQPLGKYSAQNLLLTLPNGVSVSKIQWISLWSKMILKSLSELVITKPIQVPEMKNLGPLQYTSDLVDAMNLLAIDDKTILIRKFYYTNKCLYCGFFVGTGSGPNTYGIKIPDERASFSTLRNYYNEDVLLKLPRDLSLLQLDWFAIYDPVQQKSFGFITIEKNLNVPPSMAFMLTYVSLFANCEQILPGLMQVSWEIGHRHIYVQLEATIASNQYAAFGFSGSRKSSRMIGSDVFVAYYDAQSNKVILEDFTITAKSQCNAKTGTGVCRDTLRGGRNDLELLMSSYIDGLIKVTFRRALRTPDRLNDLPIFINNNNNNNNNNNQYFVVAAIGTLDTDKNPSYHTVAVNTKYHASKPNSMPITRINVARINRKRMCNDNLWRKVINQPANKFNIIANSQLSETEIAYELKPWKPAIIKTNNNHVFHVVVGPAGNAQQGYTSITGNESPGIAFWINDLLIPELHVIRGHDYTFLIETGENRTDKQHYHPLYITNSRTGGAGSGEMPFLFNSTMHRIYGGLMFQDGFADLRPFTGRYCELVENTKVDPAYINSIENYRKTLRLQCQKGNVGSFRWRPDESTPDIVYYQSFTKQNMGWKIKVSSGDSGRFFAPILALTWLIGVMFSISCY